MKTDGCDFPETMEKNQEEESRREVSLTSQGYGGNKVWIPVNNSLENLLLKTEEKVKV